MKRYVLLALILFVIYSFFYPFSYNETPTKEVDETVIRKNKEAFDYYYDALLNPKPTEYASYEPPLHPAISEIFDNIDRDTLSIEDLYWVTYSEVFKETSGDYFEFDFMYPDDYFAAGLEPKQGGYCVDLRGIEEQMYAFCYINDLQEANNKLKLFLDNGEESDFKGIDSLVMLNTKDKFPKQEMLIPFYDENNEIEEAYHFTYPVQNLENYTPNDPDFWKSAEEFYTRLEIPISKRILNSIDLTNF